MKLGPVNKLDKIKKNNLKIFDDDIMWEIDVIAIFAI